MTLFCQKIIEAEFFMEESVEQRKENLQDQDYALSPK